MLSLVILSNSSDVAVISFLLKARQVGLIGVVLVARAVKEASRLRRLIHSLLCQELAGIVLADRRSVTESPPTSCLKLGQLLIPLLGGKWSVAQAVLQAQDVGFDRWYLHRNPLFFFRALVHYKLRAQILMRLILARVRKMHKRSIKKKVDNCYQQASISYYNLLQKYFFKRLLRKQPSNIKRL